MNRKQLFWWLGVLYSDGYLYHKGGKIREIRLRVSKSSLEMLLKWKKILDSLTRKDHRVLVEHMYDGRYDRHFDQYLIREASGKCIASVMDKFSKFGADLNTFQPPPSAFMNKPLAGAYLAGVIDGDGCIQLRKNYADSHLETLLKISTNVKAPLVHLQKLFLSVGLPRGYITEYPGHCDLWLYLGKDSREWFKKFVCSELAIKRKSYRIK